MASNVTADEFLKALYDGIEGYRITGAIPYSRFELADGRVLDSEQGQGLVDRGLIDVEISGPGNAQRLPIELTEAGRQYVSTLYRQQ